MLNMNCAMQVKLRSPQHCRERYEMLLAALRDSSPQTPAAATFGARPTLLAAPLPLAASAPVAVAGLTASSPGASMSLAASVEAGAPAHSRAAPSSSPSATAAHAVLAPAEQASAPGLTAQQGTGPAHPSSAPALQPASLPQQSLPGRQPDGSQQSMVHKHGSMVGSAGVIAPYKHEVQPTSTNGAVWDLASELQTLREHLAWLAKSNVVCSVEVCPSLRLCVLFSDWDCYTYGESKMGVPVRREHAVSCEEVQD